MSYPSNHDISDEAEFRVEEAGEKYRDLEERCLQNAMRVRDIVKKVEQSIWNREYIKQVVRSSGSVGANYIEANEFLGDKDFLMKARISRREAKETIYWLRLLDLEGKSELEPERQAVIRENDELKRIFSAILNNRKQNLKP
jgi:four helix bundle protein